MVPMMKRDLGKLADDDDDYMDGCNNTSNVYLLVLQDEEVSKDYAYMKVGVSSTPFKRVAMLRTGMPMPINRLTLIRTTRKSAAFELESRLHAALSDMATCGEWFRVKWGCKEDKAQLFKLMAPVIQSIYKKPQIVEVDHSRLADAVDAEKALQGHMRKRPNIRIRK